MNADFRFLGNSNIEFLFYPKNDSSQKGHGYRQRDLSVNCLQDFLVDSFAKLLEMDV